MVYELCCISLLFDFERFLKPNPISVFRCVNLNLDEYTNISE